MKRSLKRVLAAGDTRAAQKGGRQGSHAAERHAAPRLP